MQSSDFDNGSHGTSRFKTGLDSFEVPIKPIITRNENRNLTQNPDSQIGRIVSLRGLKDELQVGDRAAHNSIADSKADSNEENRNN